MPTGSVHRVGLVGFGAIGQSWARLLIANGLDVVVHDAFPQLPALLEVFGLELESEGLDRTRLFISASPADLAGCTDLVLEAGPEDVEVKQRIIQELDAAAPSHVLLLSSTSGISATLLQAKCRHHPERVLVAHPFNPPHLMPLVEVVGGESTSSDSIAETMSIMREWGKHPVLLQRELPGHIVNRLQAALWREAYHLVAEGYISAEDLDIAVASGPGLRWALLGPFATQHLSGGPGGFRHLTEHLGAGMGALWSQLGTPDFTPEFAERVIASVEAEFAGADEQLVRERRDTALQRLIDLKEQADLAGSVGDIRTREKEAL